MARTARILTLVLLVAAGLAHFPAASAAAAVALRQ